MTTLAIVAIVIYLVVLVLFLVAVYSEAPRHGAEVGVVHYVVAAVWPGWLIWYVAVSVRDYFRRRNG